MPDPGIGLAHALRVHFVHFGGAVTVKRIRSRPWASVTFSGARHHLFLRLEGPGARDAAEAFLASLDEHRFDLPGHLVADIAGDMSEDGEDRLRLTIEALTVEAD